MIAGSSHENAGTQGHCILCLMQYAREMALLPSKSYMTNFKLGNIQ